MEGVLLSHKHYTADDKKIVRFVEALTDFCKKHKIEVYLISGFHENVALKKLEESYLKSFFNKENFLRVDEKYISSKSAPDQKLHRDGLAKDPEYNDTYFKQVAIQNLLQKKKLFPKDALLLSEDLWVDGYYTTRFSKVDFAIFEENISERGKPADPLSGLAYFSTEVESVKRLLEKFPSVSFVSLEKFVFESMKKALIGDEKAFAQKIRDDVSKKKL